MSTAMLHAETALRVEVRATLVQSEGFDLLVETSRFDSPFWSHSAKISDVRLYLVQLRGAS